MSDSRPPKFVLPAHLQERFDKMSAKDRKTCIEFCQERVRHETVVRDAEKFYSSQFLAFVKNHIGNDNIPRADDTTNTPTTPPFELLGTMQTEFDSLTRAEQEAAIAYCQDAARAKQGDVPIRNAKNLYTHLFAKYQKQQKTINIPPFVLPRSELEHFNALTKVQQETARARCEHAAAKTIKTQGADIRNPHAFYRTAFHAFLNEYPSLKSKQPTPKETTSESDGKRTLRQLSNGSLTSGESRLASVELIRRELMDVLKRLDLKEMECRDGRTQIDYLTKLYEIERTVAEKLRADIKKLTELRATNTALEAERDALVTQVKELEERRLVDHDMQRELTATLTAISQELCRERQEKRKVEEALEAEKEQSRNKDLEIQKQKAELKRMDMLRPSEKQVGGNEKKIAALQRELKGTQDKLAKERRKSGKQRSYSNNDVPTPTSTGNVSLSDFVSAKLSAATGSRAVEISLGADQESTSKAIVELNQLPLVQEMEIASLNSLDGRIKTEIEFLASSYGKDELVQLSDRALSRKLVLPISRNNESIPVDLTLSVPIGYPTKASIQIEAAVNPEGFSSSVEARKLAMDMMPKLVDVCRCEAQGSLGNEALFFILQAADQWVARDWNGIQAKRLPPDSTQYNEGTESDICRVLVKTHHLIDTDTDRIGYLVKTATKCRLGGYIKSGYPGLLLVEGLEADCDSFFERIVQNTSKHRESGLTKNSSYFSKLGKAVSAVSNFESNCKFPRKLTHLGSANEGKEFLQTQCEMVGLESYLD